MVTILEPVGAGIIVALLNKFIINNPALWFKFCEKSVPIEETEQEDTNSSTTSVNDSEIHTQTTSNNLHISHFDPWMHT